MSAVKGSIQPRPGYLAILFQEILTAIVRLRSGRQTVSDANVFRTQMHEAIRLADQDARKRGYAAESSRFAILAVVAFLDESILNLHSQVFSDWVKNPFQLQLLGMNTAGEIFFENIKRLLEQLDSAEAADVLEVYQLCLLLGYKGRYGISGQSDLRSTIDLISRKLRRIRGESGESIPLWAIPRNETFVSKSDEWLPRLAIAVVATTVLAILLFGTFKLFLRSGISEIPAIAAGKIR